MEAHRNAPLNEVGILECGSRVQQPEFLDIPGWSLVPAVDYVGPVNETLPGSEAIYPGSHELRIVSLIPVVSPLVPEGMLVLGALERTPAPPGQGSGYTPAQISALLSELADEISRQVKSTNEALSMLGH